MKFSLMTEPQLGGTYDDLVEGARWAEAAGFVSFARSDHYYWRHHDAPEATDAFATLAGLARDTDTIRLAVLVSPLTFRHPAVVAKNAATIDQMSNGRFDLGVGTGWHEGEHEAFGLEFPAQAERFERLTEGLQYLHAALRSEPGTRARFEGDHYRLDGDIRPKPVGALPIIVGGRGPVRTPRLAGTYADEYNHFVAPPAELVPKIERVRAAAEAAGREPATVTISVMGALITGRDRAEYEDNLAAAAAFRGIDTGEMESRATSAGIPCGVFDDVAGPLEDLSAVGVTTYYVQMLTPPRRDAVEQAFAALRRDRPT